MVANSGAYTLSDVHLGDVYIIVLVPSSTVGNGSATITDIGEFHVFPN